MFIFFECISFSKVFISKSGIGYLKRVVVFWWVLVKLFGIYYRNWESELGNKCIFKLGSFLLVVLKKVKNDLIDLFINRFLY